MVIRMKTGRLPCLRKLEDTLKCSGNSFNVPIRRERRGWLSFAECVQHDTARPLTAARHTVKQIRNLEIEVLSHPLYSLHLAPGDFHFFWPL